jgi:hypothetical protein
MSFMPSALFKIVCLGFTFAEETVIHRWSRLKNNHPLWLEIMKNSRLHLDFVAAQSLNFDSQAALTAQTPQYEGVPLNEIFDLLESAVETYTAIAPTLPQRMRESAEQEIDFFYSLTQKRLGSLVNQPRWNDDRVAA